MLKKSVISPFAMNICKVRLILAKYMNTFKEYIQQNINSHHNFLIDVE
jgi:hypothetical protein